MLCGLYYVPHFFKNILHSVPSIHCHPTSFDVPLPSPVINWVIESHDFISEPIVKANLKMSICDVGKIHWLILLKLHGVLAPVSAHLWTWSRVIIWGVYHFFITLPKAYISLAQQHPKLLHSFAERSKALAPTGFSYGMEKLLFLIKTLNDATVDE